MNNEDEINLPSPSPSPSSSSSTTFTDTIFSSRPETHPCFPLRIAGNPHPPTHHRSKRQRVPSVSSGSLSKQKSSKKPLHNAPLITHPCTECGRKFWSWKALFGHMRCHPERQWRGIRPPPNLRPQGFSDNAGPSNRGVHTEEDHEIAACLMMLASGSPPRTVDLEDGEIPAFGAVPTSNSNSQFKCSGCKKVFGSHQALGGHRASHKNIKGCFAITRNEGEGEIQQGCEKDEEGGEGGLGHRCGICFKAFQSGQALGGHMRCHWEKGEGTSSHQGVANNPSTSREHFLLDLNLPPPMESDRNSSSSSSSLCLNLNLGI